MNDRRKSCLSILFFLFALMLPLVSLFAGWIGWDLKTGVLAGLITFALFFILGGIFATLTEEPSLLEVSLPFIAGVLYSVVNFLPLPFDDVIVACAGAILSSALFLRSYTNAPNWVVIPLIVSALYTLVGEFIPGPVDEILVGIISLGTTAIVAKRKELEGSKLKELSSPETQDSGIVQTDSTSQTHGAETPPSDSLEPTA